MKNIRVVILAGGKGARLRPYTAILPKPLMPIGEMPILEVVLNQLRHFGFQKITISVGHLADLIQTFFRDGSHLGLEIDYCIEDTPLGTAGSISLVERLTDPFLVMNGDLLTTLDYSGLVRHHIGMGSTATIAAYKRKVDIDFGVLDVDDNGALTAYAEKPQLEYLVSMGVNVLSAAAVKRISSGEYLGMPELMTRLKAAGESVMTYVADCEWFDIGRLDDYQLAVSRFEKSPEKYLRDG